MIFNMRKTLLEIIDLSGEKNILQEMNWDKNGNPSNNKNTKMKTKHLKDSVLELHYKGLYNKDICEKLKISPATVSVMIKKYTKGQDVKEGYFNVDELECWIFPSSKNKFG